MRFHAQDKALFDSDNGQVETVYVSNPDMDRIYAIDTAAGTGPVPDSRANITVTPE